MKIIQSHKDFYVDLSTEEILICPRTGICSSYPVWLGKNRAIMRDVTHYFEKHPPQTLHECLGIIGRFGLNGIGTPNKRREEFFAENDKPIDNRSIFW